MATEATHGAETAEHGAEAGGLVFHPMDQFIVKPLFGNGGAGVFHIKPDDENLSSLIEMFTQASREPIIAQGYLPAVRQGDKRVILVDGEAVGVLVGDAGAGEFGRGPGAEPGHVPGEHVAAGFARAYPKYPFSRSKEYLAVEAMAKKAKKGLWGLEPATPMAEAR